MVDKTLNVTSYPQGIHFIKPLEFCSGVPLVKGNEVLVSWILYFFEDN
jgi:hypothetical protein